MSKALVLCGALLLVNTANATGVPETTRKVVYQKTDTAYRLATVTAPVPKPAGSQVLVHIHAVALNRGEIENLAQAQSKREGMIAASDGAGEVVALGPDAKQFKVGERVTSMYWRDYDSSPPVAKNFEGALGSSVDGVFGGSGVEAATALLAIPKGWADVDAATLPTAGLTAYSAVVVEGHAGPGKIVLVQGTGGVSTFALQLAHAAGATVIVTSSSDEKLEKARALGATHLINYKTTPEWGKKVMELTGGHGADVVVEVGGKGTLVQSMDAVALGGTISIIGGITGYGGDLPTLPLIEHVYPLEELEAALEQLRSGQFMGKIVVTLGAAH